MSLSPNEEIPLKEKKEEANECQNASNQGFHVSRVKALLLLIAAILLLAIIVILAILLAKAQRNERRDDGTIKDNDIMPDKNTTLPPGPWDKNYLPRHTQPLVYQLTLDVDPNKEGFTGENFIDVKVINKTSQLLVNCHKLNVTKVTVSTKGGKAVEVKKYFHVEKTQYLVIEMANQLYGDYVVHFMFNGMYSTGDFGLIKGLYTQDTGKDVAFLASQFQPKHARTVFPCFDELDLKATFTLTLTYPKDMIGISNSGIEKQEKKGETITTYFKKTPKMSVCQLSIIIGHFESKTIKTPSGVKVGIFANPGNKDQLDFSLQIGNETFTQMEKALGVKYPMPKLDFIALAGSSRSVPNWGSNHLKEVELLFQIGFSSEETQQDLVLSALSRVIVQMWFGSLVTMRWWSDYWLSSAVAEYFAFHDGSPSSLSAWKMSEQFVHTNLGYSLSDDGLLNSRPVVGTTHDAVSPPGFFDTFDDIVHKKGSALLNMAKSIYPKQENFLKGMKNYLDSHSYGNAVSDDMWAALQSTCTERECAEFKNLMKTWMTETNYPVLTVKKDQDGKYIVQQERFVFDKAANIEKRLWMLRFAYISSPTNQSNRSPGLVTTKWMTNPSGPKPLEKMPIQWDGKGWIKGNFEQKGFYRVNYDDTTWSHLSGQLEFNHKVFTFTSDRYGLIDDAFNLARGERLSIKRAMDITKYIENEEEYLPWMAVYKNIQYIVGILPEQSAVNQNLKKYLAYQSKRLYQSLGVNNTGSHLQKLLRKIVVEFQCQSGSASCLSNMTRMFGEWKKNRTTTSITPALRGLVYFYGVRHGSLEDWQLVRNQLQRNTIASEFLSLFHGLAGSRDIGLLNSYLDLAISQSLIKKQYLTNVLNNVANHNPVGPDVTWPYMKYNWDKLQGSDPVDAMTQYLQIITKRFAKKNQLEQLEKFINVNLNGQSMPRLLRKTMEIVKLNVAWRRAHEKDLGQWLVDFFQSKSIPVSKLPDFTQS